MTLHEILDRLLPCKHKWQVKDILSVYSVNEFGKRIGTLPKANDYILQCEVCGEVKKRRV